jgi:hypothetical protein
VPTLHRAIRAASFGRMRGGCSSGKFPFKDFDEFIVNPLIAASLRSLAVANRDFATSDGDDLSVREFSKQFQGWFERERVAFCSRFTKHD